jgi:hypothetical protein
MYRTTDSCSFAICLCEFNETNEVLWDLEPAGEREVRGERRETKRRGRRRGGRKVYPQLAQ